MWTDSHDLKLWIIETFNCYQDCTVCWIIHFIAVAIIRKHFPKFSSKNYSNKVINFGVRIVNIANGVWKSGILENAWMSYNTMFGVLGQSM